MKEVREIKFRGKTKYGEWIYGWLAGPVSIYFVKDSEWTSMIVLKETIGQFTGIQDSLGQDIYEGEILEFTLKGADSKHKKYGKVIYKNGSYCIYTAMHDVYRFDQVEFEYSCIIGHLFYN